MGRGRLMSMAVAACCAVTAPVAQGREPVHVHWESLLPAVEGPRPAPQTLPPDCPDLTLACVDATADKLGARADALGCDHRAIFPRNYQRLTQALRRAIATPGTFSSNRFLIGEVVLFERLMSKAYDGVKVPQAWQIAFDAWRGGDTYGVQDLLLGINAHVQRDMPYVVAEMGLGSKADHDKVNEVLDGAFAEIVDEVAAKYDPSTSLFASPLTPADDVFGIELVRTWREGVWRNAEALVRAKTPRQRARVERRIETNAATTARLLAVAGPPGYGATRDAYCHAQLGH